MEADSCGCGVARKRARLLPECRGFEALHPYHAAVAQRKSAGPSRRRPRGQHPPVAPSPGGEMDDHPGLRSPGSGFDPQPGGPLLSSGPAPGPPKAGCHVRLVVRRLRAAARTMAERSASFHPLRPAARHAVEAQEAERFLGREEAPGSSPGDGSTQQLPVAQRTEQLGPNETVAGLSPAREAQGRLPER